MEEKTSTHEESIQIINSTILTARNHYYENGLSAILAGRPMVCFVLALPDVCRQGIFISSTCFS